MSLPEINGGAILLSGLLLIAVDAAPAQVTCPGSDPVVLDCNGNGIDDYCDITAGTSADANTNGIPDECDATECFNPWSGFEPAPPFATGAFMHGMDADADGSAWDNPSQYWTVANQGCPSAQGKAIKGVASNPPIDDLLSSEYFRTVDGQLDCGAAKYALTFDARAEAQLNPRADWQMTVRDAVHEADVALIHWASTQSNYPGVTAAQGGNGRGRILVKNPTGSPAFINTGFVLSANTCYQIQVVLDNVSNTVELSVNGVPLVTVGRLEPTAARMDAFRMRQAPNGQFSGGVQRLALDNFALCVTGEALHWPDCNSDCIDDVAGVAQGWDPDMNANGVPDECEADCNGNGAPDDVDISSGFSDDCDSNGVPDECQPDCNADGVPDVCDPDCDNTGVSDSCELAAGTGGDCNANGVPDGCDIIGGTSQDCSGNGTPDECEPEDCNTNGVADSCDLAGGTSADLIGPAGVGDGIPDDCQTDCNANLVPDEIDIGGGEADCNANGVPDACDIADGTSWDCDGDATPDECQTDCNQNGFHDSCELAAGTSLDCNTNGTPDECDVGGPARTFEHSIPVVPSQPISDVSPPATHTIEIAEFGPIVDVDVGVTLTHPNSSDLEIRVSHAGTTVVVFDNQCGTENHFTGTVWSDEAATPITCVAGHTGTFRPFGPLSAFDGMETFGLWTISVTDNVSGNSGTLTGWFLRISALAAADCNSNGIPDDCDVAQGTSTDVVGEGGVGDGLPDECQADCNENLTPDEIDVSSGASMDCHGSGTPDECDLAAGTSQDCSGDGTPDDCQMDCNRNGLEDFCDLAAGSSQDCNTNGTPDECELTGPGHTFEHAIPVTPPQAISNVLPPATSTFEAPEFGPIDDVDVGVTLTHTWVSDLRISIEHGGTTVILFSHQCGSENDFSGTIWSDEAATTMACTAGHMGTFRPFNPLSAFDGLEASGPWTLTVQDLVGGDSGSLTGWFLRMGVVGSTDCDNNGIPDECESLAPCARLVGASSWRTHGGGVGRDSIVVNPIGQVESGGVTSEPRSGGVAELRIAFDAPPGGPGLSPVQIEQRTCGDGGEYVPYSGAATTSATIEGDELVLIFAPALENARTYRITVDSEVSSAPGQSIEVRGLLGDANSSGRVNATDRSVVVSVWTGAGYSPATDIDLSGRTNGADRSAVISAWTGAENCAP